MKRNFVLFYVNSLFQLLRRKTTGCWINGQFHGIYGYSDDNWVLAPSISALQEMMITIETYCTSHSLKFSTDPNPLKCKTKCIAFLKKNRTLPQIVLNGNNLPWVSEGVHLGNYFTNRYDGMTRDIKVKRGQFISRNYELLQEFYFAHPSTKLQTVLLYNCHFTGSPIWDIFSPEVDTLSKSWNIAMRKVFDLPMTTHRYLLEPISENDHLLKILIERFISFISQLEKSSKNVVKQLLNLVKMDARSVTGANLRKIKLMTGKRDLNDCKKVLRDIPYVPIPDDECWRVSVIKELTDIKFGQSDLSGFTISEINEMINFACIT